MNTDPRLPLCKLYPAIVCKPPRRHARINSHAAVTFPVSISALAHTPTRAHVESRGVPQSEPGDPECKRPRSPLENSLPATWAKEQQ